MNPTYHNLGDHSETVQIDFDPMKISYDALLDAYFTGHSCGGSWSRQYRSVIFFADDAQRRAAEGARKRYEARLGHALQVAIEPLRHFYMAEDYHQKFYLRQTDLLAEFVRIYPRESDFVNSTAVARANACAGHAIAKSVLDADLPRLGLSTPAQERLLRMVR